MITRDVLAGHIAGCEDEDAQSDLAGDFWASLWPTDDCLWPMDWTMRDVEDIARNPYEVDWILGPGLN